MWKREEEEKFVKQKWTYNPCCYATTGNQSFKVKLRDYIPVAAEKVNTQ